MTDRHTPRPRRPGLVRVSLSALVLSILLFQLLSPAGAVRTPRPPRINLPFSESLATPGGTWAELPMGHLSQFTETFWQLFVLRSGQSRWKLVTPPGVADNAGLATASGPGSTLLTGFEPNQLLEFTPLASTADEGKTWSLGVLDPVLALVPDAIAVSATGRLVALVGRRHQSVMQSSGGLSSWTTATTEAVVADSTAGKRCGVSRITTVGFTPTGRPVLGATCSTPGVLGIFVDSDHGWKLLDQELPSAMASSGSEVVGLNSATGSLAALVAVSAPGNRTELQLWDLDSSQHWDRSPVLALAAGSNLVSSGTVPGGGMFVVTAGDSSEKVHLTRGSAKAWTSLPTLPSGTADMAFSPGGRIDAFVAKGTVLDDYRFASLSATWERYQSIKVPIQYGSSS